MNGRGRWWPSFGDAPRPFGPTTACSATIGRVKLYRHGDVLIAPAEAIPEAALRRADLVLALGELTGHAHRVEAGGGAQLHELGPDLYLEVWGQPARVVHEEHLPIELPVGRYRVWRQREYRPGSFAVVED